jgi:hypothetical protein
MDDFSLDSVLPSQRTRKKRIKRPTPRAALDLDSLMDDVADPLSLPTAPLARPSPGLSGESGRAEARVVRYLDQALSAFSRDFNAELSALLEHWNPFEQILAPFLEGLRRSVRAALDLAPAHRGRIGIDLDAVDEFSRCLASLKRTDVLFPPSYAHRTGAVRLARAALTSFRSVWQSQFECAKIEIDTEFSELNQLRSTLAALLGKVDRRNRSLRKKRYAGETRLKLIDVDSQSIEEQLRALVALKQKAYTNPFLVERPDPGTIGQLLGEIGVAIKDEKTGTALQARLHELRQMCDDARAARGAFTQQWQRFVGNATAKRRVNEVTLASPSAKIEAARVRMRELRKRGAANVDGFSEFLAQVQEGAGMLTNDGELVTV